MRLPSVRRFGSAWPKQETLAAAAGVSLRTLRRSVRYLEDVGLLRTARGQYGLDYRLPWHPRFGPLQFSVEWRQAPKNGRSGLQEWPISDARMADLSGSSPYTGFSSKRADSSNARARRANAATPPPETVNTNPEPIPAEIEREVLELAMLHINDFARPDTARRILRIAGASPNEGLAQFRLWAQDRARRVCRPFKHWGGVLKAFECDLPAIQAQLGVDEGSAFSAMPVCVDGSVDGKQIESAMARFSPEDLTVDPCAFNPDPAGVIDVIPLPDESIDFEATLLAVARSKSMPTAVGFRPAAPKPKRIVTMSDLAPRFCPRPDSEDLDPDAFNPDPAVVDVVRRRLATAAQHPSRKWW
ncbi:MAG: hypothetical protein HS123_03265 [Solibacteraceae bacterium]|nr:hypothetical protein [Solibacteraceae bacterium]